MLPSPRGAHFFALPQNPSCQNSREPLTRFRTIQPVSPGSSCLPAFQRAFQSNLSLPARQPLPRTSFSVFRPAGPSNKSFNLNHLARIVKGSFRRFRLPSTAPTPFEVEPYRINHFGHPVNPLGNVTASRVFRKGHVL